jgi:putative acetyltransferase
VLIRPETPSDIDAIKAVHDAAFGQADEGSIVDRLRGTADWIEGGSLVAVD